MESYWQTIVKNQTGNQPTKEIAVLIDNTPKIVFSLTLQQIDWENSKLNKEVINEEILELMQQEGKNWLAGSRSLIVMLMQLDLIDE